ncbi:hypothetical protein NMY22_g11606 [Coprinellus aureogranulatus]|nr:hypothetical protein NMY22_g11606 [Coprinellus aureogranulatus]
MATPPPSASRFRGRKAAEFLQRVVDSQKFGLLDVPLILTYDERHEDMRPFLWPTDQGIPVRPEALEKHRSTHCFKAPCCPCSYARAVPYTEVVIGLAQTICLDVPVDCLGQFVAVCATHTCSYFVALERYFSHPHLMKERPIRLMDPLAISAIDANGTVTPKSGLQQVKTSNQSNAELRGANKPNTPYRSVLKREDPEAFLKLQKLVKSIVEKGLPAADFWDLFVQCEACSYVMPRHYFPYYHPCVVEVVHSHLGLAEPELPKFSFSSDFDEADLPGPASSDPALSTDAFLALLASRKRPNTELVTPKAGTRSLSPEF